MSAQSMAALAYANNIRLTQAAWKRDLHAQSRDDGCRIVATELRAGFSEPVERLRLRVILGAIHRMGPHRATRLIDRAGLLRNRLNGQVSELTASERERLARTLSAVAR